MLPIWPFGNDFIVFVPCLFVCLFVRLFVCSSVSSFVRFVLVVVVLYDVVDDVVVDCAIAVVIVVVVVAIISTLLLFGATAVVVGVKDDSISIVNVRRHTSLNWFTQSLTT